MSTGSERTEPGCIDLRHHGDRELGAGLVDLAVNVRANMPPSWLRDRLQQVDLAAYPDPTRARIAVADRHRRSPDEVLLTAGAAEAFVLVARAFSPSRAIVVHPQFTEPEAALRAAGHDVERCVLAPPFALDPARIPDDADLVVIGNPTNPTSVLHPAQLIAGLTRPGRIVLVDEAFADCIPGEPESLAHRSDLPGLVVVRSLTKTWGLAGLRAGYLLAEPWVLRRLADAQPLWAVSSLALEACMACSEPTAVAESVAWAGELASQRDYLCTELSRLPGVRLHGEQTASFVLIQVAGRPGIREQLRTQGFAVRRGDTFPGLDGTWLRIAVRDLATSSKFIKSLREVLS
ncbi:Rv2231c family pyridoxal phosphate-dependent protein CobC [Jatrophihabitans sp. DSM 45814]